MTFAAVVVLGYVLGSCPWGYWLVRVFRHEDIRTIGSGGIGATNVYRAYGQSLGIPVVLLDVLKGFVPAFLGVQLVSPLCGILAGAAAMAGHYRPLFLRFQKGGKMVATAGGVFLGVAALVALGAAVVWLVTFAITRYASVSSIMAALSLPVCAFVFDYSTAVIVLSFASAAGVIFLHRANL
jgi:glycerol-3-phosphate acyltransferase PlsY